MLPAGYERMVPAPRLPPVLDAGPPAAPPAAAIPEVLGSMTAFLAQVSAAPRHGHHPNMRWILVHLIEEYARHCGHADLLRERIDGVVGD